MEVEVLRCRCIDGSGSDEVQVYEWKWKCGVGGSEEIIRGEGVKTEGLRYSGIIRLICMWMKRRRG